MKFNVTLKTPDALEDALLFEINQLPNPDIVDKEEILYKCRKWFKYGENVTLEIDTDDMTCTVLEN